MTGPGFDQFMAKKAVLESSVHQTALTQVLFMINKMKNKMLFVRILSSYILNGFQTFSELKKKTILLCLIDILFVILSFSKTTKTSLSA